MKCKSSTDVLACKCDLITGYSVQQNKIFYISHSCGVLSIEELFVNDIFLNDIFSTLFIEKSHYKVTHFNSNFNVSLKKNNDSLTHNMKRAWPSGKHVWLLLVRQEFTSSNPISGNALFLHHSQIKINLYTLN